MAFDLTALNNLWWLGIILAALIGAILRNKGFGKIRKELFAEYGFEKARGFKFFSVFRVAEKIYAKKMIGDTLVGLVWHSYGNYSSGISSHALTFSFSKSIPPMRIFNQNFSQAKEIGLTKKYVVPDVAEKYLVYGVNDADVRLAASTLIKALEEIPYSVLECLGTEVKLSFSRKKPTAQQISEAAEAVVAALRKAQELSYAESAYVDGTKAAAAVARNRKLNKIWFWAGVGILFCAAFFLLFWPFVIRPLLWQNGLIFWN